MNETVVKPHPKVRQVSVTADEAGQRIDNFLARHLKGVPRSHIYRILRRGEVRVNSGRIKAQYKVCAGDTVRIPPVRVASAGALRAVRVPAGGLAGFILFENPHCLVLNKPAGMAVHGGSGISQGVIEVLRAERPAAPYLELAHRLDRDTSGCLVIAKRRSFLRALHEQLRSGAVEKYYLALVAGEWGGGVRTVEAPLRKNTLQGGERIVRVDAAGKTAMTVFRPVDRFRGATLVEAVLHTGRTHQIRVHAAHIGHPLAGDAKYGDRIFNTAMREAGLRRMFLHAHRVVFDDPGGEVVDISVPLDDGLKAVLDQLESA
ncbi:MAG: 23S rRNA pseudouridine(955/2504/2580) synthase RluC [Gammaproteobacteria bacterium]